MTDVNNALDTAQAYLKSLEWDLETVPQYLQSLVQKLVHDALVARGTAVEAQSRAERQGADFQAALEKVSFLSKSVAEKEREVTSLRQDLDSQAQRAIEGDYELKSKINNSEKRILALENAAQQEAAKSVRLEAERDGLKLKVQSLLEVEQQCKALGISVSDVSSSIKSTASLTPPRKSRCTSTNKTVTASTVHHDDGICLIQAAVSRVDVLESELSITRKKAEEYKELSSALKEANAAKSSEIAGLQARLAATRSALDLQQFEQLSRHANNLGKELEELRQRSVDPKELAAAQSEKREAEVRAAAAESSRQAVVSQIEILRRELEKLQKDSKSVSCARNKVAKLRVALDECKAQEAVTRAAAELAEGRCSELQDRLERRDAALSNAQARCRSLEADLSRLRQLQNLRAAAASKIEEEEEEENEEVEQLKLQCASMSGHLQKAMELQEATLEAATAATLERDEITEVAKKLKTELEAAKLQLQDAAAAAAAVRSRIISSASSALPVSELLNASFAVAEEQEEEEQGLSDCDSQSSSSTTSTSPLLTEGTQIYVQNALSEAMKEVESARCDATEAQIEAQQEREVAETLRERCATLEAQLENLQNDIEMVDNGSDRSDIESTLRLELEQKKQECQDLAAAGAQADAAMQDCLEQLRAASAELQQTKAAAAAARAELYEREMQLASLQNAAQALDSERVALHEQLVITQAALQQQNEAFSASFEAERHAAASEFDTLRSNMQFLARQYQELCSKAAEMQRERDAATQFAEASATQAAYYEQETKAKENAIAHAEASYAAVVEDNRKMQEAIIALQQEEAAQECQAQFSSNRTHAALQRRAATAEGSTAMVEVRLSNAVAEVSMLREQLEVQATRSEELEALLLEERKKQFQEENVNIVNVINLQADEEKEGEDRSGPQIMQDAVDEAMMQRLAELEIECVQLREELARARVQRETETVPKEEDKDLTRTFDHLTAPQTHVLQQLSSIALGLKDLGK